MYLSYIEYQQLGGTLSETEFNNLSYDAEVSINYYTFDRLINDTEFSNNVKMCEYKLIDLLNTFNQYQKVVSNVNTPIINSQSNDGVSVSYGGYLGNTSPSDIRNLKNQLDKDIYNTIKKYLIHEYNQSKKLLMYRGVIDGK